MALILYGYGLVKFKKVLHAISTTNKVFGDNDIAKLTIKDNGLAVRNRTENGIVNYFFLNKEIFERFEPDENRKIVLHLKDVRNLINSKKMDKLVISGNKFYFYNTDGKLAFSYEIEIEKKESKEPQELYRVGYWDSPDYESMFKLFDLRKNESW